MTMVRKPIQIDRDKLRAEVRKLGSECAFCMLNDAIELLPMAKLPTVLRSESEIALRRQSSSELKRFCSALPRKCLLLHWASATN